MSYRHTPAMGEISGFSTDGEQGAFYEETCQKMLEAGVSWILGHPAFEFDAEGYQNIVGIVYPNNPDTQELMRTIIDASKKSPDGPVEATGAQVHAVMLRLGYIATHGWPKYVRTCEEAEIDKKG